MEDKEENIITEFSIDQLTWWEEYRDLLYQQKSRSDDHFEKAITFITSGALGLTLTFHDKIVPFSTAICVYAIAIGWTLLVATLFVNLYSHYQSSKSTDATIDDVDELINYKLTYNGFRKKLNKRNNIINHLNKASIYLLGTGLISIIIYVSINLHYGKTNQPENINENITETTKSATTQNEQSKSERAINTTTFSPIK